MSYATGLEFIQRYDERTLGDLVSDTGTRVTVNLDTNAVLLQHLEDASGKIESALLVGNKYQVEDLEGLPDNSAAYLKRLTCDVAFSLLRQRRGYDIEQYVGVKESLETLNRLQLGERVFNIDEVKVNGNTVKTPIPAQTIYNQNLMRDNTRYFPPRRWPTVNI